MEVKLTATKLVLSSILLLPPFKDMAWAEIVQYSDEKGVVHYVEGINNVPEAYRSKIKAGHKLPPISRAEFMPARPTGALSQAAGPASVGKSQQVEIFVTSWCPYCKQLEAYLQKNKVRYTRYDIERDTSANTRHLQLGGGGVPVIKINSTVLRGFNPSELSQALKIRG